MKKEKMNNISTNLFSDKDNYISAFRKNVEYYLNQPGMTIRELAERADMPVATLNNFLYNDTKDCKLSTAVSLARALSISVDELIGAQTMTQNELELLHTFRCMPKHVQLLQQWFISLQMEQLYSNPDDMTKVITVMIPVIRENGDVYPSNEFTTLDISKHSYTIRPKVFLGIKINSDRYMPYYTPYDTILIANDRKQHPSEHSVIMYGGRLYIAKRVEETINGQDKVSYYSIRDHQFRCYEREIDLCFGYIAGVYTDIQF